MTVILDVDVAAPVILAALVIRNDNVKLIEPRPTLVIPRARFTADHRPGYRS